MWIKTIPPTQAAQSQTPANDPAHHGFPGWFPWPSPAQSAFETHGRAAMHLGARVEPESARKKSTSWSSKSREGKAKVPTTSSRKIGERRNISGTIGQMQSVEMNDFMGVIPPNLKRTLQWLYVLMEVNHPAFHKLTQPPREHSKPKFIYLAFIT